jgi:uncharacterized protein YndB with AHSA1/START domain
MQQTTFASSTQAADPREIASGRVIDAPRRKVFKAFADPTHLARWWGPKGFRNTFEEFDFRPGGTWRFTMHGPDGTDTPTAVSSWISSSRRGSCWSTSRRPYSE